MNLFCFDFRIKSELLERFPSDFFVDESSPSKFSSERDNHLESLHACHCNLNNKQGILFFCERGSAVSRTMGEEQRNVINEKAFQLNNN